MGALATILEVGEGIQIRFTIEQPNTDEDLLLLVEDAPEYLYYRAAQMSDTDFEDLLVKKYERLDEN